MNLDTAIRYAGDAEAQLATQLRAVAERHAVEHDLYHLGHTLAEQSAGRIRQVGPLADKYGAKLDEDKVAASPGPIAAIRQKTSELIGRSEKSGLLLLRDLRHLYLAAQAAEIAWAILVQAALAIRDPELLDVAQTCREQTETCGKWLRTRIKESSPQILAAG